MLVSHEPLSPEKATPLISGIGYHWQLHLSIKTTHVPGYSREIFPRLLQKYIPVPEKMGTRTRPHYAFECMGGGGGLYGLSSEGPMYMQGTSDDNV